MPRGNATVDPTITTTEKAQFQCDGHVREHGLDAGALITAPGDGAPARGLRFRVPSGSAATLRVRTNHQRVGEYVFIKAGETADFYDVTVAYVSTASGTATYNYEVFA